MSIPVIDIFAGPGGLGEGFSSLLTPNKKQAFKIALSIEKDPSARETLKLRSFFRRFGPKKVPREYYDHLKGDLSREKLYNSFSEHHAAADKEAWLHELAPETRSVVKKRISEALNGKKEWVLIGGPPCQAYSLVGRSRNKGEKAYDPTKDIRQTLYLEYLQILADHGPSMFVMENVKGLLSATLNSTLIFSRIREDLRDPETALLREGRRGAVSSARHQYELHTVSGEATTTSSTVPSDFVIRSEMYGIPQARHRVIIVGIRKGLEGSLNPLKLAKKRISVTAALKGLPRLRSGISKAKDSDDAWHILLTGIPESPWYGWLKSRGLQKVTREIDNSIRKLTIPRRGRGAEYIGANVQMRFSRKWFLDHPLMGILNHSTRRHIASDLQRYFFVSCFAKAEGRSPELADFPPSLLPAHANVELALRETHFGDRFRVQLSDRPSTTITSHISKDGHYYIHPDPSQCRSLTVREAARLQTFPDNYLFCEGRTSQYTQVGNAVPPLLARQIAGIVYGFLRPTKRARHR